MDTQQPPPPGSPRPEKSGAEQPAEQETDVLRLLAEDATVSRQVIETGRVRVAKATHTREHHIDEPLACTRFEVNRVPIGRLVDAVPAIKEDGDLTIVPLVEETVVVERRLLLKEELHIRRLRTSERYQQTVKLRYQTAEVTRIPAQEPATENDGVVGSNTNPKRRKVRMAFETLVAAFDTKEHATAAVNALRAGGFHGDDISVLDHSRLKVGKDVIGTTPKHAGFWQRLFGKDLNLYEANVYGSTIDDGGTVVSVRVPREQVAQASGILDLHHPINIQDRAVTSGFAPSAHVETAAKAIPPKPLVKDQAVAVTPKLAEVHSDTLRLAEEQLQVGKTMVETGRTRVRRFTTERDAAQDVTLHEEHAEVVRRAISQPSELTDVDWADQELEVAETKEQALVSKTARVVEEVSLRKKGDDHVETIHQKLRRQQAEIQQVPTRRA
jgi:uncharacterized protein (TIGR02271 family)